MFLEEDLEIAPDFFAYFEAATPLMERDRCGWRDNLLACTPLASAW